MVRLEAVSKTYPGAQGAVLGGVNLHVRPGDFLYLSGPSGAGKTTLLRFLYGADYPTSGRVLVGGYDLGRLGPRQMARLRRKLGVIFQDFRLLPVRSVFENVALGLMVSGWRGADLARRVESMLAQVGLEAVSGAPAGTLSGGEQQRVAIARALAVRPPLLLADEPTGNLDPDNTLQVMRLLVQAHAGGATVMVATHDPVLLETVPAARVVRFKNGGLEESR